MTRIALLLNIKRGVAGGFMLQSLVGDIPELEVRGLYKGYQQGFLSRAFMSTAYRARRVALEEFYVKNEAIPPAPGLNPVFESVHWLCRTNARLSCLDTVLGIFEPTSEIQGTEGSIWTEFQQDMTEFQQSRCMHATYGLQRIEFQQRQIYAICTRNVEDRN
ncbi:hypothetical protein Peur_064919 [Populus x canadensis]